MKYAAMRRIFGRFGSVDREGTHGQYFTQCRLADNGGFRQRQATHLGIGEFPHAGGTSQYFEGAIVSIAIIKMQAQREHVSENINRSFNVWNTILQCPISKSGNIPAFLDSNDTVLMPPKVPVAGRCFVKSQNAYGTRGYFFKFPHRRSKAAGGR